MPRRRDKAQEREVAAERVDELVRLADRWAREGHAARADRAVDLARRIAERTQLGYPAALKVRMCRECGAYVGGSGARRRLTGGRLTVTCLRCGAKRRRPVGAGRAPPKDGSSP